jgi:hypothetical protein
MVGLSEAVVDERSQVGLLRCDPLRDDWEGFFEPMFVEFDAMTTPRRRAGGELRPVTGNDELVIDADRTGAYGAERWVPAGLEHLSILAEKIGVVRENGVQVTIPFATNVARRARKWFAGWVLPVSEEFTSRLVAPVL